MTMSEQGDKGEIPAVADYGCRPKVTTLSLKTEAPMESVGNDVQQSSSCHIEESDRNRSESGGMMENPSGLNSPLLPKMPTSQTSVSNRGKHVRSFSDCTGLSSQASRSHISSAAPDSTRDSHQPVSEHVNKEDSKTTPRFLEDGGRTICVPAGGQDYPKRQRGQSLVEYLMSNQSGKSGPELDRENAHFSVSEAMIAAIEETRFQEWKMRLEEEEDDRVLNGDVNDESDEEIRNLKLELQAERSHCSLSYKFGAHACHSGLISSISPSSSFSTLTPTLSPSCSPSSVATTIGLKTTDPSDSGVSFTSLCLAVEKERRRSRKLARLNRVHTRLISSRGMRDAATSPSSRENTHMMTSAPIDVCNQRNGLDRSTSRRALNFSSSGPSSPTVPAVGSNPLPPLSESAVSAENVALSLLGHFSQLRLPNECDLEWLVSEKDAPQNLLPMPRSWPVNPDESFMQLKENEIDDGVEENTNLRGNLEWAPPRPQIVFAVYSSPNLKVVMAKQNYRCAGCGMRVEPEYSHIFRYCHYLGRYFCTACHTNKTSVVPSRIFKKWDFKKYPVSNFSFDLLERMWFDPLFRLGYINPFLYRRCRQLSKVLELRTQLVHVGEFLRLCRFATDVWEEVLQQAPDWLDDPEIYSLHDLTRVNSGDMFQLLRKIVSRGMSHVVQCELCKARGFLCEKCHSSEVIFPFQVDNVIRCEKCGSCYHRPCWTSGSCPRCERLARRSQNANTNVNVTSQKTND